MGLSPSQQLAGAGMCQGCVFLVCTASSCPVASKVVSLAMCHHTGAFSPLDIYCLELSLLPKVVKSKTERKAVHLKNIRKSIAIIDLKSTVNQFNIVKIYTIFTEQ